MFLSIENWGWWPFLWGFWKPLSVPLCSPIAGPYGEGFCWGKCFEAAAVNVWQNILRKEEAFQSKKLKLGFPHLPMSQGHFEIPQSHPLCDSPPCQHMPGFQSYLCSGLFSSHNPSFNVFMGTVGMMDTKTACGILGMLQSEVYTYSHESAKCRQNRRRVWIPTTKRLLSDLWISSQHYLNHNLGGTTLVHHSENLQVKMLVSPQQPHRPPPHPICFGTRDWEIVGNGACRGNHSNGQFCELLQSGPNWIVWKTVRLNVWQLSPAARALNTATVAVRFGPDSHPKYRKKSS